MLHTPPPLSYTPNSKTHLHSPTPLRPSPNENENEHHPRHFHHHRINGNHFHHHRRHQHHPRRKSSKPIKAQHHHHRHHHQRINHLSSPSSSPEIKVQHHCIIIIIKMKRNQIMTPALIGNPGSHYVCFVVNFKSCTFQFLNSINGERFLVKSGEPTTYKKMFDVWFKEVEAFVIELSLCLVLELYSKTI
ncbi:uncharacterized protein LOC123903832 [Trifolium pratense]|uniref:uncharacterized protein LOC123903832 n=1 Tax=Trifolium pratense TaxID=57577 RepID=UPI001E691DBE|nr:uncharacterized protein LOC123903832 [Trifolium pratense]